MISEQQIRGLLQRKAETKNLDYKQTLDWNTASRDEKCELVKDILSMFNTRDGGWIVLGVVDKTYEPVGLDEAAFRSFDTTKLNDFVHKYTDPRASCEVQKATIEGKRYVVIHIPEFKDVPIICKADANNAGGLTILKRGGLYVRTDKASSELISSSEDMRDLMGRALLKTSDQLLHTIQSLFTGQPLSQPVDLRAHYDEEIGRALEFFSEVLPLEFFKTGRWEVESYPHNYNEDRVEGISDLRRLLSESEVSLRGWNFPHTDQQNATNFSRGRQSFTIWPEYGHTEAYRLSRSGLFLWQAEYWEDAPIYSHDPRAISFGNVIFQFTEYFLFFQRLYERIAPDESIHLNIRMVDTKGRRLKSFGEGVLFGAFVCSEPELTIAMDLRVAELRASAKEIARKVIKRVFDAFNWDNATDEMIEQHQSRLLSGRF
jgi:hypothetical protein